MLVWGSSRKSMPIRLRAYEIAYELAVDHCLELFIDSQPEPYGIPDREWAELLYRADAFERRVSDLIGATNLIADEWVRKVVSPPPKARKIDTAGRAALEAFQKGFEQLAKSRSHGAMRDILGRMSPHWRDGDFHIPGVDEHEIIWPGTLAFEISEFLDQRPEGRPRKDVGPSQVAAESLIEAWIRNLRKPANMKYGPGSTLWFFEGLLVHIQPNIDTPRAAPPKPRRRAAASSTRTALGDEVLTHDEPVFVKRECVSDEQFLRAGDFMIALSSGSKNLVGKAAFVADDFPEAFGGFCGVIRLINSDLQGFARIFLQSNLYRESIAAGSRGIGINNLKKETLSKLFFPLPPLAEQHRIVAKVDELMELCDRLEAAREAREATLDRMAAATLARLNTPDPDTFKDDARFALDALPALTTRPDLPEEALAFNLDAPEVMLAVRVVLFVEVSDFANKLERLGASLRAQRY